MPIQLAERKPPNELDASQDCLGLIMGFEGYSATAYADPYSPRGKALAIKDPSKRPPGWERLSGAPWTIGFGFTENVKEGDTILYGDALDRLKREVAIRVKIVQETVKVPLLQGEFDALVSIVYNLKGNRIPPTMLNYLNGGVTDKGVKVGPQDYEGAMYQFPRNCRAGGIPSRGLYRRRLAESCVFASLPWENACSTNLIRLELTPTNEIDKAATTSLEDTLLRARSDFPLQKPPTDVSKPWPTTITIIDEIPPLALPKPLEATIDGVKVSGDELVLDTPIEKPAGAGAPNPAGEGADTSQPVPPLPPPATIAPAPQKAPQPAPSPPKQVDVSRINVSQIRVENGVKPLEHSDRAIGFAIKMLGLWIKIMAGRGVIPLFAATMYFEAFADPFITTCVISGVVWCVGQAVFVIGNRKRNKHLETASTLLT